MNDLLEQLHDIHLPTVISWWPLAPGWWMLLVLILLTGFLGWSWWRRRQRQTQPARSALRLLKQAEADYARDADMQQLLRSLFAILRRTVLTIKDRNEVASVSGEDWLLLLDNIAGEKIFQTDQGRAMQQAAYRSQANVDVVQMLNLCRTWLRKVKHV